MKNVFAAVILTIAAVSGCSRDFEGTQKGSLMIQNVTIVSAERTALGGPSDVLIENGRIVGITAASAGRHENAIDGDGLFLAPGLIDGHTHLDEIPGMTYEHEQAFPGIARGARLQIPRSFLYHGFTTVVDLNSRPEVIRNWNQRELAPRAWFCGAAPVFDGYPMSFMPKPVRYRIMPYFLFDETRADQFPDESDPNEHSPEAVANRIKSDGGICVKTHFEPGFGGRGDLPVPTAALARQLIEAAHSQGLPVLLHANSQSAQSFGLSVGVDAFAHGMWTWNDRAALLPNATVKQLVSQTIDEGIALQPTIQVLYGEKDLHDPDYFSRPELVHVLPRGLIDWYHSDEGQWWRRRMQGNPHVADLIEKGRWNDIDAEPMARVSAMLSQFSSSGGKLLFGSDTPSDPTFANPPGLNGRLEMERWIDAGVTPEQLFRAATIQNAEFFGLDDEIGTVEVGKQADLLLLGKNPMLDSTAYDSIQTVILSGRAIPRSELSATH